VAAGSRVKKGDIVAEFDRQYMLLRLDDYRANLDQQQTNLLSLKANLDVDKKAHYQSVADAKAALDKARYDLKTIPVQSAIVSEQLKLAEEEAAARYKQLQSEVKYKDISQQAQWKIATLDADQNKIEFQRSEANANRLVFRAPIDGIAVMGTTFRGSENSQIRAGDEIHPGTMFMRIVDPSSMVVNASVNQADIEMLRVGSRAKVRFDAYPDLELPGHVYSLGAMPKTGGFRAAYVKEIPVMIRLEKLDPRVVPDLSVSVDVVVAAEQQAVMAPLETIFRDKPGAEPYVFVHGAAGWQRRPVELGLINNVVAAVRSGLRPGEMIAAERPPREQQK
jgi:multidrug resistance efflux pump